MYYLICSARSLSLLFPDKIPHSFLKHFSLIAPRPAPKITWRKNNLPLVHGKDSIEILSAFQGRLLNIINVRKDIHEDQYSCEAENSENTGNPIKHNINLKVEGKMIKINELKFSNGCKLFPPGDSAWGSK